MKTRWKKPEAGTRLRRGPAVSPGFDPPDDRAGRHSVEPLSRRLTRPVLCPV